MRKLFLLLTKVVFPSALVSMMCPVSTAASISPVGSVSAPAANAFGSTLTFPVINLPAGDLLIVQAGASCTAPITVTDTARNTFRPLDAPTSGPIGSIYFDSQMFYAKNTISNSADVITIAYGSSCSFRNGLAAWYSGIDNVSPLAQHGLGETNNANTFSHACQSRAFSTTATAELIVSTCTNGATNRTFTAGSGYTLRVSDSSGQSALEDRIVSTAQTNTTSMTSSGAADSHIGLTATFKASSSPPNIGTIYYQTNFETPNSGGGTPCKLSAIGNLFNINPANTMSDSRLSVDAANNVHGQAHGGNCSALDLKLLPSPDGFGQLEVNLNGSPTEIWVSLRAYLSNTWTAKSSAHQGAMHMYRIEATQCSGACNGAGSGPEFEIGEAALLANDVELVSVCSQVGGNCVPGAFTQDTSGESGVQMPSIKGAWHCWEMHARINTPGQANGLFEWYQDGAFQISQTGLLNGGNFTWTFSRLNLGSNVGGGGGASTWDFANKWFYTDDVVASQFRNNNCAVGPTKP